MKQSFLLVAVILAAYSLHAGEMSPCVESPAWLHLLPEMEKIAAADGWAFSREDMKESQSKRFLADFTAKYPTVRQSLTPEAVRKLSRWAKKEMETYDAVTFPEAGKIFWQPIRRDAAGKKILLETTLDTLPTHSPLVTRWLKLFAIYDISTEEISVITVTIRGEVLE